MKIRSRYTQRLPRAEKLKLDLAFFEGSGTKAIDFSGKGNNGVINGATWASSTKGASLYFDGIDDYVVCPSGDLTPTNRVTVEFWFCVLNWTGQNEQSIVFTVPSWAVFFQVFNIWHGSKGGYIVGSDDEYAYYGEIFLGEWAHAAIVYDGTSVKVYRDGALANEDTELSSPQEKIRNFTYWNIGRHSSGIYYFKGQCKDIRAYQRVLSAAEIKRRYEQTRNDYVRGG